MGVSLVVHGIASHPHLVIPSPLTRILSFPSPNQPFTTEYTTERQTYPTRRSRTQTFAIMQILTSYLINLTHITPVSAQKSLTKTTCHRYILINLDP